ncbi:hypothetical protein HQ520_13585, partial [bacterium]|nr:hypothetical protein [bacterium]
MRFSMGMLALFLVGITAAGFGAEKEMVIDCDHPGGNIIVEKIEGDDVSIRQDLRDTAGWWFYWSFRVRGAEGRTLNFRFGELEKSWHSVLGVRGPAVSLDRGQTWRWLGRETVTPTSFTYQFAADAGDVRFSFAMPYQESNLARFLEKHEGNPHLRREVLCQSRKGRPVEVLYLGCLSREPAFRLVFTCRHHACEMMASYALEGAMEEILSDTDVGKWLCENVEFLIVPFVDRDGVEDGDQGKQRKPWDHVCDYGEGREIYPETAAIKRLVPGWTGGKLVALMDLHCPGIRGRFHEVIMTPYRLRGADNWERAVEFLKFLDEVQHDGPLAFRLSDSQEFTTWTGPDGPKGANPCTFTTWARDLPGVEFAIAFEIPYANAGGQEVNQETARWFGHDLARAACQWLKSKAAVLA